MNGQKRRIRPEQVMEKVDLFYQLVDQVNALSIGKLMLGVNDGLRSYVESIKMATLDQFEAPFEQQGPPCQLLISTRFQNKLLPICKPRL